MVTESANKPVGYRFKYSIIDGEMITEVEPLFEKRKKKGYRLPHDQRLAAELNKKMKQATELDAPAISCPGRLFHLERQIMRLRSVLEKRAA